MHGKQELVNIGVSKSGTKTVNGKPSSLKVSANYTVEFGLAVANLINPYGAPNPKPDP